MEKSISLTRLERQLLLYDIFYYLENVERQEILSRLPVGDRMLQRDLRDLTEAGLIRVEYSRRLRAYVRMGRPEFTGSGEKRRNAHLLRLRRIGCLMHWLENDEVDLEELFRRENYVSCAEHYRQLFPGLSERVRQRDFAVLCRIGYPIVYIREIGYYAIWCETGLRDDFGVFRGQKGLQRNCGKTDLKLDELAARWPQVKEKMLLFTRYE
ncbi:MAG: hypothetical protein J6J42_07955 [Lachnospiraceae bacterium]|nr:hypothetical protein [Lachnospiraceae bacterium]